MRVKSEHMRGKNITVGRSVFSFNGEGLAEVPQTSRWDRDLAALLTKPGYAVVEDEQPGDVLPKDDD